ncbi:MAG TPA: PAS domain S-box protein [Deltaproteobacteria bacterium]|jgi:PAS domain S-box-containing protein|nr:PAS domain S-box protein [Deltaproteobacteria bacterium]HOI06493.1 PAS domain S-box protein [Deltaproteobacteria bacterium]
MQRPDDTSAEKKAGGTGMTGPGDALLRSPALLQAVLDTAPAGVEVVDAAGRVVLANAAMEEIAGGPVAGTASPPGNGRNFLNLDGSVVPYEDLPLSRALRGGEAVRDREVLVSRPDGTEAVLLASATPVMDGLGMVVGAVAVFQDVTGRRQAEHALHEAREQLRLAQTVGHVGILSWDPATNTGSLSAELKTYFGLPADYPVSIEHWSKVTPMEDIRGMLDTLERAAAEHRTDVEGQYRVFRPDGDVRWISARGLISYDTAGKAVRVVGVAIDVTDLRRAQEALSRLNEELEARVAEGIARLDASARSLKDQKELLQAIIDGIPVVVTLWKTPRELIMVNKEFERLSGWSQEEALHMDIMAASFPDPAYRREIIRRVAQAGPGWGEFQWTTRSGRVLDILWAASDLSNGSRVGIGIDVTERRKMERDLLRLVASIDQAGEGFVLSNSEWVVEYVNPAFEHMTGFTKEKLIGRDIDFFSSLVIGDFDPDIPMKTVARGEIWSGYLKVRKENGEHMYVHLTASPVRGETGEIINYVSVVQDITNEARLQQMVIQSQKMEAIGSLAGGIAHDLKNIFTPILINSEVALEDIGPDSPARPLLEEILNAARVGGDLVRQIMTFARRTPGRKVPADVISLVRETLSLLRSTIPSTIDIRHRFSAASLEVQADPTQLKQVLMNLGSNAAYAMREHGGLLEVDVACVELDSDEAMRISPDLPPGSYVRIDVCDTGEGMDEETRQHVFDPFFTTKGHTEGTGLGLAVVQGIVKGHQGAVSVRSRPGEGTTFSVLLPRLERTCPA